MNIPRHAIETAYSFFHQKQRVYQYSTMEWQKDDIEYAIGDYVRQMNPSLFRLLAADRSDFLLNHQSFGQDLLEAVEQLETML